MVVLLTGTILYVSYVVLLNTLKAPGVRVMEIIEKQGKGKEKVPQYFQTSPELVCELILFSSSHKDVYLIRVMPKFCPSS